MRRLWALLLLGGCGLLEGRPAPTNDCEAAAETLLECGVGLPLLTDGACVGLRAALARCTLEHSSTCDELSTLSRRPDLCLQSLIDPPPRTVEPTSPLFPGADADAGVSNGPDAGRN